jgi:hypothetical protein
MDPLEELVLSGKLFQQHEPGSPRRSPSRSPSPAPNTDDELFSDLSRPPSPPTAPPHESIGMGPGRTGVKGVIRDRNEVVEKQREKKEKEMKDLRSKMEKLAMSAGGKTYFEEVEEKKNAEKEELEKASEEYRKQRWREIRSGRKGQKFGHLREVGVGGFVDAVEKERSDIWVVMHIYDPVSLLLSTLVLSVSHSMLVLQSLDRCSALDATLANLARFNPSTKFVRTKASSIGFAALDNKESTNFQLSNIAEEETSDPGEEVQADLDMLPTILIYRGGELLHTWVRVDWEAGKEGVENLLKK